MGQASATQMIIMSGVLIAVSTWVFNEAKLAIKEGRKIFKGGKNP
jgi:cbb3-type cytochrome oxidase subunit 3